MHACTIVARNYLAHARVLARSFLAHHPGSTFHTLVLDAGPPLRPDAEPFSVIEPGELFSPDEWGPMWFAYSVMELATACKARLLRHVLDRFGETATYFDPDIRFYRPMAWLDALSARHAAVLVPHNPRPLPEDDRKPTEQDILLSGAYNLGFISTGQESRPLLDWWGHRLERQCLVAPRHGLFVDQRWMDLAPGLFDCRVVGDQTVDVAYWNVEGRSLSLSADGYLVNGEPLTFFHFSGYDPHVPWLLSKHGGRRPRALLSESPALRRLCDEYAAELLAAGYEEVSPIALGQAALTDGVALDDRARRVYRDAVFPINPARLVSGVPNPLTDPVGLVAWLREPGSPGHPPWLSRYLFRLYRERPHLRRAFPQVPGEDSARFLAWVRRHGGERGAVPEVLMPPAGAGWRAGLSPQPKGEGVNVVGYLRGEFGLGEAARQIVGAAQALGVPLATLSLSPPRTRQEEAFIDLCPVPGLANPYDVNLLCVNSPQAHRFAGEVGPAFFSGRRTVGYWAWELEEVPEAWLSGIDAVDEIWMNSEHAAGGVRRRTGKPVRVFPIPVRPPAPGPTGRGALGIPPGFLFLFVFDYSSVFERKNPVGVVRAFCRAFSPGEGPVLVVKSVRGEVHLDKREWLRREAAGRPDILLLEGYLSPADKNALLAACDCYVSLHRAEGFGLTMAEAMALGKPTVATGYSGNLEFMTPENSYLVGFTEGRVPPGCRPYPAGARWAEPDLDEAAAVLRRVYDDPGEARRRGERARADLARDHGPEARAALLARLLAGARSARGEGAAPAAVGRAGRRGAGRAAGPGGRPRAPGAGGGRARLGAGAAGQNLAARAREGGVVLGRAEHAELQRARRDLVRILNRLGKPPLGWILSRSKAFRRLRERWLP